jgi:excinuclease ABC subunit A
VLDEPATGLHVSDVARLVGTSEKLVARGDTLVVIEHQPDVIRAADWVVELGPEAGEAGGRIVFEGPPSALARAWTATGIVLARGSWGGEGGGGDARGEWGRGKW